MKKLFGKIIGGLAKAIKAISKIPKALVKLIGVKGTIIVVLVLVIAALIYFGIGAGLGNGAGDGEGDGNTKTKITEKSDNSEEQKIETTEKEDEDSEDVYEGAILMITVVESEYFYENERIALEDFVAIVEGTEGELVVKIKDDRASLKAYNKLLDELDKLNVEYIEETGE